jgi:hypothetical protein
MASSHYQDGLLVELDRILASLESGTKTSADFEKDRLEAEGWVESSLMAEDWVESPYVIGRHTVLEHYCARTTSGIEAYYLPGNRFYNVFDLRYWEGDDSARTRARSRVEQSNP